RGQPPALNQTEPAPEQEARHCPDFRSVYWFGKKYSFTQSQAVVVKMLWEAWENGTPDVGKDTLILRAGCESNRLSDVFSDRKGPRHRHHAWGVMIVAGSTKGSFR